MPVFKLRKAHKDILKVLRRPKAYFEITCMLKKGARQVSPRLSELATHGLVIDTGMRRLTKYRRPAIVWRRRAA